MTKKKITAVLGPTNTGKTHLAIETMLSFESGMIGFPLRLLAREVYDKVIKKVNKRDQEIKDYIKGVRDLQTTGLQRKWHLIRFSKLSVINGGRAKGVPRKGGNHGRKWAYIVHPNKTH